MAEVSGRKFPRALALALLAAAPTAHDGGVDVTNGHAQIVNLTLGTLPLPVTPPENVRYVAGDNGFTGDSKVFLGSYNAGLQVVD